MAERLEELKLAVTIAQDQLRSAKARLQAFSRRHESVIYMPLDDLFIWPKRITLVAGYWRPEDCVDPDAVAYAEVAVLGAIEHKNKVVVGYKPKLLRLILPWEFEDEFCTEAEQSRAAC